MPRIPDGLTFGSEPVSMTGPDSFGVALDRTYTIKLPTPRTETAPTEPRGVQSEDEDDTQAGVVPARAPR